MERQLPGEDMGAAIERARSVQRFRAEHNLAPGHAFQHIQTYGLKQSGAWVSLLTDQKSFIRLSAGGG